MLMFSLLLVTGVKVSNAKNSNTEPPKKDKRPNIIFLLTDDQRYNALGCMGNSEIETPNIDRLAEKGVIFTNHYDNTAICMGMSYHNDRFI